MCVFTENRNCISPISGSNGNCVHIRKCAHLNTKYMNGLVNNRITPETGNYLRKFAESCSGAKSGVSCYFSRKVKVNSNLF